MNNNLTFNEWLDLQHDRLFELCATRKSSRESGESETVEVEVKTCADWLDKMEDRLFNLY